MTEDQTLRSYPIPILRPPYHHRYINRSPTLSPRLDLPGILSGHRNETRSLAIVDLILYSAGEYKLASLTWLLWALRSCRRFTLGLHYGVPGVSAPLHSLLGLFAC